MGLFSRKVIYSGSMSVDPAMVRQWEEYAQISGKSLHIPGGAEPNSYLKDQVAKTNAEAKAFRERKSRELDDMRKKKEKPDEKLAEKRALAYMKKHFKWKR
jgi:hypothetical protein